MLEVKNVSKEYFIDKKPFKALKDISLSFPNIQFVSILGPSGCGKTTLLNLLGGIDTVSGGHIYSEGEDITTFDDKKIDAYRNNRIGFIFQNYFLIPQLSVLENVKIALSVRDIKAEETDRLAKEALERVHALDLKDKKPNQLSGGQAQRVAIARAIVTDPSCLLCDEPTGALDSKSAIEIMEILKSLSSSCLVIMVTHNEQLASEYSNRIIRMNDGEIIKDELINKNECDDKPCRKDTKISRLSFLMSLKLAFRNILSRKLRTILTAVANSFGMIGIAFLLAINNGFNNYSTRLSSASATSLPVVINSYDKKTETDSFANKNASVAYPDKEEIYPSVDLESQTSYTYNGISAKYENYLDTLVEEGIIREYIKSYGNSYSYNLSTTFPSSINGEHEASLSYVKTTLRNYNYYAHNANLPYNIFHVLYGDISQYDVIAGKTPETENELVLVVDKYNAIDFDILKALGFYNSNDKEEDVMNLELESKVKPISFADVLSKEYSIFGNDEIYINEHKKIIKDGNDKEREVSTYKKRKLTDDFYNNNGIKLKISGIVRPKQTSPFSILSPALCYTNKLQEKLMPMNTNSRVSSTIKNNMVFTAPNGEVNALSNFLQKISDILNEFIDSKGSVLPTSKLNEVFDSYFLYYPIVNNGYRYKGFSYFFSIATSIGAELVNEELKGVDLSNEDILNEQIAKIQDDFISDYDKAYDDLISLIAYANAYSTIQCLVIFPTDLSNRNVLIERLDEYNNIVEGSPSHASSESEKIYYAQSDANVLLQDVGEMISLVSAILIIFAVVSLIVSCAMTSLLVSNNVLERRKEIGLLRSLGSRKKDVLSLFEIESFIVGITAGIIGSLTTFTLCFPLNYVISIHFSYYNVGKICDFNFLHALIVTMISIVISLISALIPSYKASKVSPVDSLRSE